MSYHAHFSSQITTTHEDTILLNSRTILQPWSMILAVDFWLKHAMPKHDNMAMIVYQILNIF